MERLPDLYQDVIDSMIPDITEDHAFAVLRTMEKHFGWQVVVFSPTDLPYVIQQVREDNGLPPVEGDELAAEVQKLAEGFTFRAIGQQKLDDSIWNRLAEEYYEILEDE
jgi:hypothetical protein